MQVGSGYQVKFSGACRTFRVGGTKAKDVPFCNVAERIKRTGAQQCPYSRRYRLSEAQLQSASGPRAALMREYVGYIEGVATGEAGRLTAGPEESLTAIRRRLGAAARHLGREISIKRTEDALYFWHGGARRRRNASAQP